MFWIFRLKCNHFLLIYLTLKNLYNGYKKDKFINYLKTNNPNFLKYENKKKQVKELINRNIKVSEIVKITGIPFQTIYKWKKEF